MVEKAYQTMKKVGAGNIVLGIVTMVSGIAAGVLMIVGGSHLLKNKKELTF